MIAFRLRIINLTDDYVHCTPYYIKLPNRRAVQAAVKALLDDGAGFRVTASGDTASITISDTRAWRILEQVNHYYRYHRFWNYLSLGRLIRGLVKAWRLTSPYRISAEFDIV